MTIDYDTPRQSALSQDAEEPLQQLKTGDGGAADLLDSDDTDLAEGYKLPDADLSGEELTVRVVPQQADEFVCTSCFLVHHRSNLAELGQNIQVCRDCA